MFYYLKLNYFRSVKTYSDFWNIIVYVKKLKKIILCPYIITKMYYSFGRFFKKNFKINWNIEKEIEK